MSTESWLNSSLTDTDGVEEHTFFLSPVQSHLKITVYILLAFWSYLINIFSIAYFSSRAALASIWLMFIISTLLYHYEFKVSYRQSAGLDGCWLYVNFFLDEYYEKQCKSVYLKIFGPFLKQCPIEVSVQCGRVPWGLAVSVCIIFDCFLACFVCDKHGREIVYKHG